MPTYDLHFDGKRRRFQSSKPLKKGHFQQYVDAHRAIAGQPAPGKRGWHAVKVSDAHSSDGWKNYHGVGEIQGNREPVAKGKKSSGVPKAGEFYDFVKAIRDSQPKTYPNYNELYNRDPNIDESGHPKGSIDFDDTHPFAPPPDPNLGIRGLGHGQAGMDALGELWKGVNDLKEIRGRALFTTLDLWQKMSGYPRGSQLSTLSRAAQKQVAEGMDKAIKLATEVVYGGSKAAEGIEKFGGNALMTIYKKGTPQAVQNFLEKNGPAILKKYGIRAEDIAAKFGKRVPDGIRSAGSKIDRVAHDLGLSGKKIFFDELKGSAKDRIGDSGKELIKEHIRPGEETRKRLSEAIDTQGRLDRLISPKIGSKGVNSLSDILNNQEIRNLRGDLHDHLQSLGKRGSSAPEITYAKRLRELESSLDDAQMASAHSQMGVPGASQRAIERIRQAIRALRPERGMLPLGAGG